MTHLCRLIAFVVYFFSIGKCFVIEPIHTRAPCRQSQAVVFATSPHHHANEEDYSHNQEHRSAPMEMSRRGFLMSSLASVALFPSALLAAPEPLVEVPGKPDSAVNLRRHNSTHSSTSSPSRARSRAAASKRYRDHDTHHEEDLHKSGPSRPKKVNVKKPAGARKGKGGTAPKPPRIKGVARSELFLKVSEALV